MNKIALLFIAVFMSNPAFSQTRHFEISYNFGILQDSYTTGNYNTIPLLNPEIRIGYELINNCIVSLNYGFWDNNVKSLRDLDGIIIDASIINHTDNSFGILINKKNTNTFLLSPFIGCSVHILKSYTIESMSGHHYEKKAYGCIDFGLRIGYKIKKNFSVHIEAQGSKFLFDDYGIFLKLFKTGVTLIR